MQKKIRETTEKIVNNIVGAADEISTDVILHRQKKADVFVRVEASEGQCGSSQLLAERISAEISKETGISNKIKFWLFQFASLPLEQFRKSLPEFDTRRLIAKILYLLWSGIS